MPEQTLPAATVPEVIAQLPELLTGKNVSTVVLPDNNVGLAFAQTGDAYPRVVILVHGASSGVYVGDGKSAPANIAAGPPAPPAPTAPGNALSHLAFG
jgi:hypothetical protein